MSLSPLGVSNTSLTQSLPCGRWTEAWRGVVATLSWPFWCCLAVNNNVVIEHLPCPGTGLSALKALSSLIFRKPWEKGRCSNYHHVTDEKASAEQALAVPRVTEPGNGGAGSQNQLCRTLNPGAFLPVCILETPEQEIICPSEKSQDVCQWNALKKSSGLLHPCFYGSPVYHFYSSPN